MEGCQHPVGVDAAVPVEAAVEHRVEVPGRSEGGGADVDVGEAVRVLAGDVAEADGGEAVGLGEGESHAASRSTWRRRACLTGMAA